MTSAVVYDGFEAASAQSEMPRALLIPVPVMSTALLDTGSGVPPSFTVSMTFTCAPVAIPESFVTSAPVIPEFTAPHCAAVNELLFRRYSNFHAEPS